MEAAGKLPIHSLQSDCYLPNRFAVQPDKSRPRFLAHRQEKKVPGTSAKNAHLGCAQACLIPSKCSTAHDMKTQLAMRIVFWDDTFRTPCVGDFNALWRSHTKLLATSSHFYIKCLGAAFIRRAHVLVWGCGWKVRHVHISVGFTP